MTDVTGFDDLTPEQIDEHMKDDSWGDHLESMVDRLLEDSGEQDKKDAYALISMFVQTSYMGQLFNGLQSDSVNLFKMGDALYKELASRNITCPATEEWSGAVQAIDQRANEMQGFIREIGDQ
jgi:hypothetical protein